MSRVASWDASTWLWAGLCCLMILFGLVQLLQAGRPRPEPARASDGQLRYGRGADLAGSSVWLERIGAVSFIALGLLQLLTLRQGTHGGPFAVGLGVFIVAAGLWLLLFVEGFAAWHRRRYDARLAARIARGRDAYFEELRELEAYPPAPRAASSPMRFALGALYVVLGGAMILVNLDS